MRTSGSNSARSNVTCAERSYITRNVDRGWVSIRIYKKSGAKGRGKEGREGRRGQGRKWAKGEGWDGKKRGGLYPV